MHPGGVAGVHTLTTSSGYTMTLTIGSDGQMHAAIMDALAR